MHRDIKPENILIDKRGRVKIADFGLAKLTLLSSPLRGEGPGVRGDVDHLTATGQVMGTLRYMAPEQMQGSREVDHRADIFSLGVVFYELLTGELPMGKFAPPSKKVQVDVRLDEVVLRALEQDPEQRYQHASDVKSELETIRTMVAPPQPVDQRDPLEPFRNVARFAMTPNPSYAKRVGIPMAILFGLFAMATIAAHAVYGQKDNYQEQPLVLIIANGAILFWLGVIILHVVFFARRGVRPNRSDTHTETPTTQMRFAVPATTDLARQAVFHFVTLGYRLIEQQPDVCVFQRGGSLAGLWETDIRNIHTILTVRTAPPADARQWVSCDWSVRRLGAWITRRDIAKLEAEGRGLATLLGGQSPPELPVTEPRFSRFAIAGAVFALFGLLTVIPVLYFIGLNRVWNGTALPTDVIYSEPPLAFSIFMGALLAIGAGAPIGTTIFGALSIGHIKRSEGKILGLPLAKGCAMFFPLIMLGAAAFLAGFVLLRGPMRGLPPMSAGLDEWFYQSPRQEFAALLIALPIWFFPARALWRLVVGPRNSFELRKLPLVGDEPLTGKAALVVALAAIAAHGWPWHWIIPLNSTAMTISNFNVISALQSVWLLVGSIGLALFASAATLARAAKWILRIGSVIAVIAALVIQVQFYRSLGEYEPGHPTVVRQIRSYYHMGLHATMALTGLAILFSLLRVFDEPSRPNDAERVRRPIGPEQISLWSAILGVVLPALLLFGGIVLSSRVSIPDGFVVVCFLLGVGLELVAIGCGVVSRSTTSGKAGLIVGSIALILWIATLATIPTRVSTERSQPADIIEFGTRQQLPE